jgi:hypothetical protein
MSPGGRTAERADGTPGIRPLGLRTRIAWFAEHFDRVGEEDLVGESWFVAVREEAL